MRNILFKCVNKSLNLLLLLLITVSCKHKKNNEENVFFYEKELIGTTLIESDSLKDPWDLCIKDKVLLIGNFKGNPQIDIFNLSGLKIASTLQIGEGPSEVLCIGLIQSNFNDDLFYVYDLLGKKILEFNIKSVLKDRNYEPSIFLNISHNEILQSNVNKMLIAKDYLVCDSRSPEGRLLLLSPKGEIINYYMKFPGKVDPNINDNDNAKLFGSAITINPVKDRLAIATSMSSILDIVKLGSTTVDSIWSFHENLPNDIYLSQGDGFTQAFFTLKSKLGYLDIASSEKYVYALYSGLPSNDPHGGYGNIIRVVSWDGKDRFIIKSDRWLNRIEVDINDEYIYAVSLNEEKGFEIVSYKL